MAPLARLPLRLLGAGLVIILASAGCSIAPKADRPLFAPAGSTWVVERHDTGSFGNGVSRVSVKALGRQTWQGRPVIAIEGPTGTTLLDPDTANWVASVRGATPLATFDPPLGYVWPIAVGKTWTRNTRVTSPQGVRDLRSTFSVEAHEEVTVPAGTFKVFRIRYADQDHENVHWWDPEFGLRVKTKDQRYRSHPAGLGTRDSEMISLTIAK
jgi:hypothetical protein